MIDERAGALDDVAPYPIPSGRGRWRLTLHSREYLAGGWNTDGAPWSDTQLVELTGVRSRRIDRAWCKPATLTFTADGRDPAVLQIRELQNDVYVWRWDDWTGRDVCVGRFLVDHSQDIVTEESHTVVFSGHDYLAMLERRMVVGASTYTGGNLYQEQHVENLVYSFGINVGFASGDPGYPGTLLPGSYLPLAVALANPDGTPRTGGSGPIRYREYEPGGEALKFIDDLSKVINGFEYDLCPMPEVPPGYRGCTFGLNRANKDALRIFYPVQGVERSDVALVYGGNVAAINRTVSSEKYSNRVWAIGNSQNVAIEGGPKYQLHSDAYNLASAQGTSGGLWQEILNAADVLDQGTLDDQAHGALELAKDLVPSYTVTLRPGSYRFGFPNMGDTVQLVIQSGRLAVDTTLRIVGISYDVGDDGNETVELQVGRAEVTLGSIFKRHKQTLDALNRK